MPAGREPPRASTRSWRRLVLAAIGLVLVVAVLYAPVRHHDFVNYDDDRYVTDNRFVRDGLSATSIRWALTATHASNWHPVTWLSHMLDVELYGLDPAGHHLTSVAIHAANAVLLMLALYLMTARFWPGLLVALLFAVHPLRVESVAWVAERKDVLGGTFWLLTLVAYALWVKRPGVGRYLAVVACFALGLAAKPMLVTLPFVLLLLDGWPLRRMGAGARAVLTRVVEKLPMMALAGASAVITGVAQREGGAMRSMEVWSFGQRLANALIAYVAYLWKTLWPVKLACFYPHPASVDADGAWIARAAGAGVLLVVATVLAVVAVRRRPYFALGWFWYLGTLVPVIGIVQVGSQAMADRYTYLPLIGIYVVVAWGLAALVDRRVRLRVPVVVCVVVVLTAFAVVSRHQVGYWRDSQSLFEHALRVTRDNYVAHTNLGSVFEARGELARAAAQFEQALRVRDDFAPAHDNLGLVLTRQGELQRAIEHLERAVELDPGSAEAHNRLGAAFQRLGRSGRAVEHFARAVSLDPDHVEAHNNLGVLFESRGDTERAETEYERALQIDPDFAEAHSNLGNVLLSRGDLEGARAHYERALRARADLAEAHNNLAFVLARGGDHGGAVSHYRRALEIRPAMIEAAAGLAWLLATSVDADLRNGAEALTHATLCVEGTRRRDPACLEALAAAHAELGDFKQAVRWQSLAVSLVPPAQAAELRSRLRIYRTHTPHRH